MLSYLGLFFLCLALSLSIITIVRYFFHWRCERTFVVTWLSFNVNLIFVSVLCTLLWLTVAFVIDDFSNAYVLAHSNTQLPLYFKIAAVWGGHEGSMLFWVVVVAVWMWAIKQFSRQNEAFKQPLLITMIVLLVFLASFVLFLSSPFELAPNLETQGRDLNPMLQDIALILHPPLLYLGYVGFSAPFAAALVTVYQGQCSQAWFHSIRLWLIICWCFLSAGMALGCWWAYYELGWGGWWFWDPVENASLLPWLTATAAIHCFIPFERKAAFPFAGLTLVFASFGLSLLGTFIVRSGLLTSVHAFAIDNSKGVILIVFSALAFGSGLFPLFWKAERFHRGIYRKSTQVIYILMALLILLIATITVLLGTFYPMIFQALNLGQISVGAPYFNLLFSFLSVIGLIVLLIRLSRTFSQFNKHVVNIILLLMVVSSLLVGWRIGFESNLSIVIFGLALSLTVGLIVSWLRSPKTSTTAHLACVLLLLGAVMNGQLSHQQNTKLALGQEQQLMNGTISFHGKEWLNSPNYTALKAKFMLTLDDVNFSLVPERRHYPIRVMNMSEPAVKRFWHGDVYLSLGEPLGNGAYLVKLQYKSGMAFVWGAMLLLIMSGVWLVRPSSYRSTRL